MELAILNLSQATRSAPVLASPSLKFHTTSTGGHFSLDIFNVQCLFLHGGFSGFSVAWSRTHNTPPSSPRSRPLGYPGPQKKVGEKLLSGKVQATKL
ncbi:hypothetical protein TNCV_2224831 [Trichonephila clavipes]|nr:hypothetical protein TNCV_2224831 [Trichonephila clavipes]